MSLSASQRVQRGRAQDRFGEIYGRAPSAVATAPGRVNLIGEHTDYNDGFVLPMAIERQTLVLAAPAARPDRTVRVATAGLNDTLQSAEFPLQPDLGPGPPQWSNYVRGVVTLALAQGIDPGPLDLLIDSTIPPGGGLSSSAALEIATSLIVEKFGRRNLGGLDRALLCQQAEHRFAGMPCGIMDQAVVAMATPGAAMLLDCRSHAVQHISLDDPAVVVLIANSHVKHDLSTSAYAERRAECGEAAQRLGKPALRDATIRDIEAARSEMEPVLHRRARHVITENERTVQTAALLHGRQYGEAGARMHESHLSLRDDYEVSCSELDLLVDLAMAHHGSGVYGSRMTGGGFGGCTVTLLEARYAGRIAAEIAARYHARTGIEPTMFTTRAAAGAHLIA